MKYKWFSRLDHRGPQKIHKEYSSKLQYFNRWQVASPPLRSREPYYFRNFEQTLSRVEVYVGCIRECGANWLGLKFKFPLIWWSAKPYRMDFSLTKAEEQRCWRYWIAHRGFMETEGTPEFPYNFSYLHEQSSVQDSDSE